MTNYKKKLPQGTPVRYWPIKFSEKFDGQPFDSVTRTEVETRDGRDVVWLKGKAGFVLCDHLERL